MVRLAALGVPWTTYMDVVVITVVIRSMAIVVVY